MTKTLHITIAVENEAFFLDDENRNLSTEEVRRILNHVADRLETTGGYSDLLDSNGNTVGYFSLIDEE